MIRAAYLLAAMTSVACAGLLLRGYLRSGTRLLLWSALGFCGLALNNVLLVVDKVTPLVDLSLERSLPALGGMLILLYGLIMENR